ncbi:hypothetical protein WMY93_012764 [Mugilogobius chulae]|uniref:HECT domain-containing protein n=1 Tax=Mugilogobius chulae TaxID=88201 RepID=A0AAW0NY66_9GOBI
MFAFGEQSARGFKLKGGTYASHTGDEGCFLDLSSSSPVTDLCVGPRLLSFVNRDGNAFIIRLNPGKDGAWVRGRQKHVESKKKFRAVSCTNDTLYLLSDQGQLFCVQPHVPLRPFEALRGVSVSQVSCGSHHSLALTRDGRMFSWGVDARGQLGLGKSDSKTSSPQPVRSVSELLVVQVAAGGEQSFCLTVSGGVWSWGCNSSGQLGLGDTTDRHTPHLLQHLNMKQTCHISCGEAHTAVLTQVKLTPEDGAAVKPELTVCVLQDGAVYTFGSGQHGQLGHNSFRDELRPRLVAELRGSKVTAVACGRLHTVLLTHSHMYFCGVHGPADGGRQDSAAVPLLVQLPCEHTEGLSIRQIFAGEHCSYATRSLQVRHMELDWFKQKCLMFVCLCDQEKDDQSVSHTPLTDLINIWISGTQSWRKTKREITQTFSSASYLNRSFLDHRKHFETSPNQCGLDLNAAQNSFSKLLDKPTVMKEVERACKSLIRSLSPCPVGVECLRVYLLLTEFLHVLHQPASRKGSLLAKALATVILKLPGDSIRVLGDWWSALPADVRERHVLVWKNAAVYSLNDSKSLLQVLQLMYNKNKSLGPDRTPNSIFNIPVNMDMVHESVLWKLEPTYRAQLGEVPILFSFPFLMNFPTRHLALRLNNEHLQSQRPLNWLWPDWWFDEFEDYLEFSSVFGQPFTLRLRREHTLEDTFAQLSLANQQDFRKPLQLISAESGMFMFNDSATLAWFSSRQATPPLEHYFLFGVLCGLAVYHFHMVFLPFPLALFKKLLGVAPCLDDLCQLSPCTGKSLRCLLEEYSDDVIQSLDMDLSKTKSEVICIYCMLLQICWDQMEVALDPDNPDRPVTAQNKEEFVSAFVEHVFTTSVKSQFKEFRRGFFSTADRHIVELFSPEELRDILVGRELTDWSRLKQSAVYEGVFHENHPTIRMFWEVFDELTEEQRKALLWFITGFETLPILTVDIKIRFRGLSSKQEGLSEDHISPNPTHATAFWSCLCTPPKS